MTCISCNENNTTTIDINGIKVKMPNGWAIKLNSDLKSDPLKEGFILSSDTAIIKFKQNILLMNNPTINFQNDLIKSDTLNENIFFLFNNPKTGLKLILIQDLKLSGEFNFHQTLWAVELSPFHESEISVFYKSLLSTYGE